MYRQKPECQANHLLKVEFQVETLIGSPSFINFTQTELRFCFLPIDWLTFIQNTVSFLDPIFGHSHCHNRSAKVFEETPEWAKRVKPLDEIFYIPDRDGKVLDGNHEDVSEEFKAMNIIVQTPHIHFI